MRNHDRSTIRIARSGLMLIALAVASIGCGGGSAPDPAAAGRDPHSFARPGQVAVRHLELDLTVDFDQRRVHGVAALELDRKDGASELWLDTDALEIRRVTLEPGGAEARFELGETDPLLGRALRVELAEGTERVEIDYASSPGARALQWLEPSMTAGGRQPFLLSQSQAILARTWIPCQDSPGVRMTYDATVRVPPGLMAVMSAENPVERSDDGLYRFSMPQPIPSYLLALAVGDIEFRPLGERTGIYAEPSVIERAAWEFADTEAMMTAAEALYGPYRWGRYDMIVLPPSFPYGGMENPRLTFLTPTILAGDRSLTALVAHELAHSWSGNLVTNAAWDDFWINEGFTSYLELRIMEAVHGRAYSEMLAALAVQQLYERLPGIDEALTALHMDLDTTEPDDAPSAIAYDKGYLFLRTIEERVGRAAFDEWLRDYFDRYAFRPMTSDVLLADLDERLIRGRDDATQLGAELREWVYRPGIPDGAATVESEAFVEVDRDRERWLGGAPAAELDTEAWTTHHWLRFVSRLPEDLAPARLAALDREFGLTATGNSEVLHAWLMKSLPAGYEPAWPAAESFLGRMGRLKFLAPLYKTMLDGGHGERARAIYREARPGYHAVSRTALDRMFEAG